MIAKELVKHEKVLEFTSIYEAYLRQNTDRKVWLVNTNKLVRFYDGVDGLKTGFTNEAGYCMTATAKKNGMRLIAVVMKEPDTKTRNKEITEMLDYAFAQYEVEVLLSKDSVVATENVEKGKETKTSIVPMENVNVLNKKMDSKRNVTYDININTVVAPLKYGDVVGSITIKDDNKVLKRVDLTVKEDLKKANIFQLYWRNIKDILGGNVKL
jgi:D-alanyl-D-alanine carboxypeptidase (penicillin-binding protein 5/6)